MNIRVYLSALLLCLFAQGISAQELSVKSFRLLENDLTANTHATMVKDKNGEVAALIKVVTTEQGFGFDGGMVGVVEVKQQLGEIWVYVPHGIKRITMKHAKYGILRDYYFPIPIEKARTYELVLTTPRKNNEKDDDIGGNFFILHTTPRDAVVYIDGKLQPHKTDGSVSGFLPYGEHTYRVEAASHKPQEGTFIMSDEKNEFTIQLSPNTSKLTVKSPLEGGQIYLNGELKGITEWSELIAPGMYLVELRLEGYKVTTQAITLNENETKVVSMSMPEMSYGNLSIDSDPLDCSVFFDEKLIGKTPGVFKQLRTGTHKLRISKDGYQDFETKVIIEENGEQMLTPQLQQKGTNIIKKNKTKTKEKEVKVKKAKTKKRLTLSTDSVKVTLSLANREIKPAIKYYKNKVYSKALVEFYQLAEKNNPIAFFYIGECFFYGRGTTKNLTEAVNWYTKSADHGFSDAQYKMGLFHEKGIGVLKDKDESMKYFKKAAAQGHAKALYRIEMF